MSLRLEMLQVARLSPRALGESTDLVATFLGAQQRPDGGFSNRDGASDLYYTVFALDGLIALHHESFSEATRRYLQSFGDGAQLDFVHLSCLARAWAAVSRGLEGVPVSALLDRIERFRAGDGGYNATADAACGSAYGAFLALGAYQDLRQQPRDPERLLASIDALRAEDGAYGNQRGMSAGQTSSTAAAIAVRRQLGQTSDESLADWLLARAHPQGGFVAAPATPMPDLLSTATALHALSTLPSTRSRALRASQSSLQTVRDRCLDFVDSLWTNRGGFYGHWADDHLDCEYTFYGLLALGHLSV